MTRNRHTQMIADWLEEENISLVGLNAKEIEEKVRGCLFLNCELGHMLSSSKTTLYIISQVQWEELVVK